MTNTLSSAEERRSVLLAGLLGVAEPFANL